MGERSGAPRASALHQSSFRNLRLQFNYRSQMSQLTVTHPSFVPALIVVVAAPNTFLELIGKDPTLTGRTEIWAYVIPDIWMKPWLGWGYFGFWQLTNPVAFKISNAMHWVVSQAHNGLLEFLLNVGVLARIMHRFDELASGAAGCGDFLEFCLAAGAPRRLRLRGRIAGGGGLRVEGTGFEVRGF